MKRIVAVGLTVVLGAVFLMAGDADAWRRRGFRHYRYARHRIYRPWVYYPSIYYSGRSHHRHGGGYYHTHGQPVYQEVRTYRSAPVYRSADNSGQVLGAILGGIGGGVIGSRIGGGRGRVVATVAGSIIGLLAGGEIGKQLDERQRLILASTTDKTLETSRSGTEVPWRDPDSGAYGTVTPRPAYQNARGEYCREYQQKVTIDGKTNSAYGTACRQPDGSWKFAD